MFTSNLLRIFGMHAMLVRYIIHFILLLCPDCIIYITKYRANYEFYNCLHNEKFTLSEYLQIQSQHSFFMSIHSGKAALLKYFWKANTKRILNTEKSVCGGTNKHSIESACSIHSGLLLCCFAQSFISLLVWRLTWKWKRVRKPECQCEPICSSVIQHSKSCTGCLKQRLSPAMFSAFLKGLPSTLTLLFY